MVLIDAADRAGGAETFEHAVRPAAVAVLQRLHYLQVQVYIHLKIITVETHCSTLNVIEQIKMTKLMINFYIQKTKSKETSYPALNMYIKAHRQCNNLY